MTTENPFDGREHDGLVFRDSPRTKLLSSEDCPRRSGRNGCGTIRSAGKLVRMPYAICRLVPGLMSKLNHPSRARRRRQMRCGLVRESEGPLPVPAEDKPLPDRPATNTTPPTIANAEATATAGDEIKDDVASADPLLGDRSRPRESTAPPTPVKESAEKQKPPAGIARSTPKLCPELMLLVLDTLAEYPFYYYAANKAGIHRKTLAYWIRRSEAGDDGYDIEWEGIEWRFHEHCKSAIWEAVQKLLDRDARKGIFWLRQSSDPSRPCDVQDRPGSRGPRLSRS